MALGQPAARGDPDEADGLRSGPNELSAADAIIRRKALAEE
jgi:hypothetical protein